MQPEIINLLAICFNHLHREVDWCDRCITDGVRSKISMEGRLIMIHVSIRPLVLLFAASGMLLAQPVDPQPLQTPPAGGWRSASDQLPTPLPPVGTLPATAEPQGLAQPVERDAFGQPQNPAGPPPAAQPNRPAYGLPQQVTLRPGTFVNVRIDQELRSNRNQPGDSFAGTLMQPIVVDGVVVALRGQAVYGRVAEAGKVNGVSRLGIELTELTLADGSQVPVRSQFISRQGGTTPAGDQAGTIIAATAVGAIIGSAADHGYRSSGSGAAIGAGFGAAAGIIGVLATRNKASIIYPETALTFRIETALIINTGNAPQAYRYVGPDDYSRPATVIQREPAPRRPTLYLGPSYYPYPYPYYWGTGISIGIGRGIGWGHGGYRRWR